MNTVEYSIDNHLTRFPGVFWLLIIYIARRNYNFYNDNPIYCYASIIGSSVCGLYLVYFVLQTLFRKQLQSISFTVYYETNRLHVYL